MAVPKVFISSTCYDLSEVRDSLESFIRDFGFDPVRSEHGDVFFHPDLHTHDACLHELSNCQILVLIIGGRFGGHYVKDKAKSITNAEYAAAKEQKLPIFAFVKKGVLENERLYRHKENKGKKIDFPDIEKQEDAVGIFEFIADVRGATKNNGMFPFDRSQEILELLRKQWAGMFFDFLKGRQIQSELSAQREVLASLSSSSRKLEDLVKEMYKSVDTSGKAAENIVAVDAREAGWEFLFRLNKRYDEEFLPNPKKFASVDPSGLDVIDFLVKTGYFSHDNSPLPNGEKFSGLKYKFSGHKSKSVDLTLLKNELGAPFTEGYAKLDASDRLAVVDRLYPF